MLFIFIQWAALHQFFKNSLNLRYYIPDFTYKFEIIGLDKAGLTFQFKTTDIDNNTIDGSFHTKCKVKMPHLFDFLQIL